MEEDLTIPKKPDRRKIAISRIKRRILRHVWAVRIAALIAFVLVVFLLALSILFVFINSRNSSFLKITRDFIFTPKEDILSLNGRTNILILGKGGAGHEAPDLTDTMILVSVSHPWTKLQGVDLNSSITLVSLPRDLWISELRAKLNSVYYWGNQKQPAPDKTSTQPVVGGGLILAKSAVEQITGQPIQYALVVDFSGFRDVVDVVGGINVNVERSFTDKYYPIPGREDDLCNGDPEYLCRYETVKFEEGLQYMDGETALKFVRSRKAEGDEGTDIAREQRQQKVIEAIKNKVFSWDVILSPRKIKGLIEVFKDSVETDTDSYAAAILARRFLQAKDNTKSYLIPEEYLLNPPLSPKYDNLYVFIPRNGNWDEVHAWIKTLLD